MVGKKVVVKLGGSVLKKPRDFYLMAKKVKKELEMGHKIVLVVSAMKGETDRLIQLGKEVGADEEMLDSIAGLGEVLSARLMAASLNRLGVKAVAIDPSSPFWPVYTDERFGDANVDLHRTCGATISNLEPLLKDSVPVVCGYLGKSRDGRLTTLGRGGSDTTAVVLARCLKADEVILVKDSPGVLTADPKVMRDAKKLDELDASEALLVSLGGAKVLHHKALRYLTPKIRLRVVPAEEEGLTSGGTVVSGYIPPLEVDVHPKKVSMITLVLKEKIPHNFKDSISISYLDNAAIVYVDSNVEKVLEEAHKLVDQGKVKAVTLKEGLAMIKVWGAAIEEIPGIVSKITEPLAERGINIFGVQTVHNRVAIFVDWEKREEVATHLRSVLA